MILPSSKKYYQSISSSVSNVIDIVTMDIHRDLDTKNWGKTIM